MYIDILLLKENQELVKKVYFTTVYRYDQCLIDSLYVTTIALGKIKKDFPNLAELYAKSDNTYSYHDNFYIEALYQFCCERQI